MSPDPDKSPAPKKTEQKKEILIEYRNFSIGKDKIIIANVGDGGEAPPSQPPKPSQPPPSSKKKSAD